MMNRHTHTESIVALFCSRREEFLELLCKDNMLDPDNLFLGITIISELLTHKELCHVISTCSSRLAACHLAELGLKMNEKLLDEMPEEKRIEVVRLSQARLLEQQRRREQGSRVQNSNHEPRPTNTQGSCRFM